MRFLQKFTRFYLVTDFISDIIPFLLPAVYYMPNFLKMLTTHTQINTIDTSEASIIANWWQGIRNSVVRERGMKRQLLMELYTASLKNIRAFPITPVYAKLHNFVYFPVSSDKEVHYEFLFNTQGIEIALHLEGKYSAKRHLIDAVCEQSELDLPINQSNLGCGYILKDIYNNEQAAQLMDYLISISLPILRKNRLINNPALLRSATMQNFNV